MALDEVLLEAVRAGRRGPTFRLWGWQRPALVLGSHQSVRNEVEVDLAAEAGFTLTRRISGGGTMLAEPGRTVTYSIYAPADLVAGMSFVESFCFLDAWAVAVLRSLGVPAGYRPINDIVSPQGKIGGAAQARRGPALLHHTTMAYSMDQELMTRLIRIGKERVSPAGIRSANRQVSPLDGYLDLGAEAVGTALMEAFGTGLGAELGAVTRQEWRAAHDLVRDKYTSPKWIGRLP